MDFLKLLQRIVLKTIAEEKVLTALSIIGVGLGIGLFLGVNVATERAVSSFGANISSLGPAFDYEVVSTAGLDFPEEAYRTVRRLNEKSVPFLETSAYVPGARETLIINGIYTVKSFLLSGSQGIGTAGIERFLTDLNAVAVTRQFADRLGLSAGNIFSASVYSRKYLLTVAVVLDRPGLPANTAFMDLGNFQEYFGKTGFLSRIDVMTGSAGAAEIGRALPPGLAIEKKQKIFQDQKALIDAFRFNLRFVTFLAVLVGVFLLYNTVFISVVKRRREIGILRGLGMSRKTVAALFTIQGLGLGAAGSLLGVLFGRIAASFSSGAVERTVTQFFGAAGSPSSALALKDGLEAAGLGLAVSFLASLLPALEAAKVSPKESLREGSFEQQDRKRVHILSVTGFAAVLCGALMVSIEYRYVPFRFPWLSYAGIVLFILGATLNAAPYLGAGLAILRRPLVRIFKSGAVIALGDTGGSRRRFSMALMSVAVSAALIVATVSSIYSFRKSFIAWLHTYISADLYIKSASCTSNFCFSPLPREVVESVEHLSGKEAVNRYRALPLEFHGQKIVAGFSSAALSAKYRTAISADEKERLLRLTQGREVVISDYLKVRYHLKQGDVIELLTPKGKVTFTVSGTATSYSTLSGFLYTDRRWLREYWGLDDATELTVYLRKGERTGAFASQLEQSLGNRYALDISNTDELRRAALAVFDRSFALTYAIELTAIAISLIGVVNALLILVFERKREISVLRYLGASWQQVREVMVLSAGIVGLAGLVLGLLLGSAIGLVITRVINKISFGWEVGLSFPVPLLAALAALLFVTTLLAGLVPSYLARKIDSRAFISFE